MVFSNIAQKRALKLLSGEEIVHLKSAALKDVPSGLKNYAPDGSWLEQKQIKTAIDTYHNLLDIERIEKKSNLSTAVWIADEGRAKVTKKTGKHWEVFGRCINSVDWLLPEEALFLLEIKVLELYQDDVPLSIEQTYSLVIGVHCSLQEYRAYSHLSRKGYRLLRHDRHAKLNGYEKALPMEVDATSDSVHVEGQSPKRFDEDMTADSVDALEVVDCERKKANHAEESSEQSSSAEFGPTVDNSNMAEPNPQPELAKMAEPTLSLESSATLNNDQLSVAQTSPSNIPSNVANLASNLSEPGSQDDGSATVETCSQVDGPNIVEPGSRQKLLSTAGSNSQQDSPNTDELETTNDSPNIASRSSDTCVSGITGLSSEIGVSSIADPSSDIGVSSMSDLSTDISVSTIVEPSLDIGVPSTSDPIPDIGVPSIAVTSLDIGASSIAELSSNVDVSNMADHVSPHNSSAIAVPSSDIGASSIAEPSSNVDVSNMADHVSPHKSSAIAGPSSEIDSPRIAGSSPQADISNLKEPGSPKTSSIIAGPSSEIDISNIAGPSSEPGVSNMVESSSESSESSESELDVGGRDKSTSSVSSLPHSPECFILEKPGDVIEIEDEESDEDLGDVEITEVRPPAQVDTVDLLDTDDEDDDVVFVSQNLEKSDPLNCRQWFLTRGNFINAECTTDESPTSTPPGKKGSKLQLIDYFDLSNKTVDAIMKAIPRPGRSEGFINAPDQRFLPKTILPKFAHYRINLHFGTNDRSNIVSPPEPAQTLTQVVPYGRGNRRNGSTNRFGNNFQDRNNHYYRHHRTSRGNYRGQYNSNGQTPQRLRNSNDFAPANENGQRGQSYFRHNGQDGPRVNSFQPPAPDSFQNAMPGFTQDGYQNAIPGFMQNNQPPNLPSSFPLDFALQQANQMQIMAMTLVQSSRDLIQQCSGQNMFGHFRNNSGRGTTNHYTHGPNRGPRQHWRPFSDSFRRRGRGNNSNGGRAGSLPPPPPPEPDIVEVESDEDCKVKPAMKRVRALNAIANANTFKRAKTESRPISFGTEALVKPEAASSSNSVLDLTGNSDENARYQVDSSPGYDVRAGSPMDISDSNPGLQYSSVVMESSCSEDSCTRTEIILSEDLSSAPHSPIAVPETSQAIENGSLFTKNDASPSTDQQEEPHSSKAHSTTPEQATGGTTSLWKTYMKGLAGDEQTKTVKPLISYEQQSGFKEVFESLQIIGPLDETMPLREEIKVSYDIFLPNQPFKKSLHLKPNYRLIVTGSLCFPSVFELNYLKTTYNDDVPFLYAVVSEDSIGFYNLTAVSLPTLNLT